MYDFKNSFFPNFLLIHRAKCVFFSKTCFANTISEPKFTVWVWKTFHSFLWIWNFKYPWFHTKLVKDFIKLLCMLNFFINLFQDYKVHLSKVFTTLLCCSLYLTLHIKDVFVFALFVTLSYDPALFSDLKILPIQTQLKCWIVSFSALIIEKKSFFPTLYYWPRVMLSRS